MNASTRANVTRLVIVAIVIAALGFALILLNRSPLTGKKLVGVIQPLQHIAVSDITRGIKDTVGLDSEVLVQNANGDKSAIAQIIAQYRDKGVGIFVPIFTATAQATKSAISDRPIVFAAVTDPVAAGLLTDIMHPGGSITGVSDLWPIAAELDLIRKILPAAKIIGVVYDPGDPSAAATMPVLKAAVTSRGFVLQLRPVSSAGEVPQALASLGRIDLLFTANDVTVTAAFPALVGFAIQNKIPLFAGDYSSVERGAIAAVGQSYYNVGLEAGKIVHSIQGGASPGSIPVVYTSGSDIYLNSAAAQQMGVVIPPEIVQSAKQVYTTISDGDKLP
jgi:putative tryptophan/tyrosine transport system substrate-binding protein